jgi:hypothetical protein
MGAHRVTMPRFNLGLLTSHQPYWLAPTPKSAVHILMSGMWLVLN